MLTRLNEKPDSLYYIRYPSRLLREKGVFLTGVEHSFEPVFRKNLSHKDPSEKLVKDP